MFLRECEAYPEVGLGHFLITIDRGYTELGMDEKKYINVLQ